MGIALGEKLIGPQSRKLSGDSPLVSLAASSNSFCILALRFLQPAQKSNRLKIWQTFF